MTLIASWDFYLGLYNKVTGLLSKINIFTFDLRHHKLWGVLSDPGDGGGKEGGRDGDAEEGQDTAARREEDGETESQTAHGWWL